MTLSIVIPCYNGEPWLDEALASVAAQTRGDWEAVIVDDGSTDRSAAIARQWCGRDARVRLVQQANAGLPAARNAGARATTGDRLVFLDCDDLLEPGFLEVMAEALDDAPNMSGAACEQIVMRTDGTRPVQPLPGGGGWLAIDDILPCNGWAPHAALVRRLFSRNSADSMNRCAASRIGISGCARWPWAISSPCAGRSCSTAATTSRCREISCAWPAA